MKTLQLGILLSIIILSTSIGQAQNQKPIKTMEEKSVSMTEKLDKKVKLNDNQKPKVIAINSAYIKSKKELDDKIKSLENSKKELKKKRNEKINTILTEEQKKQLEASKKKKKKKKK